MSSRILIVGNDTEYYELLSNCCTKYDILTLKSIHSLSEFVSSQKVDLILSIISDNYFQEVTLFEQLKQQEGLRDIPIIVIDNSPFPIPNNSRLAFQSGARDYIKNHCDEIELLSRIENQLKQFSRWNEMLVEYNNRQETLNLMDRLFLLMDRADNSFIIFDAKGEIEWVNEGFNRLYGYTLDEFKRKFGRSIFEASKNPEIIAKVEHCIKTKKSVNYVAECLTHSGEFKWIQTTFTPIVSNDGSIDKFIAIETDITKLKEAEEALNQKNEYMIALTNHLKSSNSLLEEQQKEINTQNNALVEERKKTDELLLNILPFEVARQLKSKGEAKPRSYKLASVLFLDFVNFTKLTKELSPKDLISILDSYFKAFDDIVDKHFIEKIKTIGDAYMCAGGLPLSNRSNPFNVVLAGLELQYYVQNNQPPECLNRGLEWQCRIGIHSGDVISGVVGKKKFIFDIWGTTVNLAARMQEEGTSGRVNISEVTYSYVSDYFECDYRGKVKTKWDEMLDMYYVNRLKPEYSLDENGLIPNELFNKMMNSL
ncbi:MAG: adenylate/guanylate cyclase domain-containing protein [Salinivirgaceae bacterium]